MNLISKSTVALLTFSLSSGAVLCLTEGSAAAQTAPVAETVSPTAKGIVGGALLGGEVVMITEAIIGVRSVVPYLIGGGLGAAAGGVAGYFIESSSTDGRVPLFMLAGGLALVIPTLVLTLNATRYRSPSEDNVESQAPTNEPKADPGQPGGAPIQGVPVRTPAPAPAAPPAPAAGGGAPLSLVNLNRGSWSLAVPVPEVRAVYSQAERSKFGLKNETELRLPVVNVAF
jgi:hypothetical protein